MSKQPPAKRQPHNFVDLRQAPNKLHGAFIDDVQRPQIRPNSRRTLLYITVVIVALVIITLAATIFLQHHRTQVVRPSSPVPTSIQKAVSFSVYYPDSNKLPAGYLLNRNSFSAAANVIIFTIDTGSGQRITVTQQLAPPAEQVATFEQQRLPLHTDVPTAIGAAHVGALNGQSFASLLTPKTWLLITAPYTINQVQFRAVLQSLRS